MAHHIKAVPVTAKDKARVANLLTILATKGLTAAVDRASRDASRIETPSKAEARAYLLDVQGANAVAAPFANRGVWLRAQGVTG